MHLNTQTGEFVDDDKPKKKHIIEIPEPNTVLHGEGAPPADLGNSGDFYIDTASWLLHKKGEAWGAGVSMIGADGLSIKGDKGDSIIGKKGDPGKALTPDEVRPIIKEEVEKEVAKIPPPKDGKSIAPSEVKAMVDAAVSKIPIPKNGEDGKPAAEIEMGKSATHIQWRRVGTEKWHDLIRIPKGRGGGGGGATVDSLNDILVAGANITLTTSTVTGKITVASTAGGSGHTIEDEGTPLTARTNLNFVGAGVSSTDDAGNDATVVTIAGSVGDVVGPASAVDNAISRYDGTTGKLIQGYTSGDPTISDTGVLTMNGGILFGTDNTYDIGASGATRPRRLYLSSQLFVNGTAQIDGDFSWASATKINGQSDGILRLTNAAGNDFTRLQLGGTTSSFPAIKRNAAALNFRLADDSADAAITAAAGTFSGVLSGSNLSNTNTGDQTSIVGITGTKAQFDTAVTDGNILYVGDVTQYTDEMAQDATGAMVDATLVYVDATPLLTRGAITGDVAIPQASNTSTLATVNSNVGAFGSATQVAQVTLNAKGLTTAGANVAIAIPSTAVTDFAEAAQDAVGNAVGNGLDYDDTSGAIAVDETELLHNSLGTKQGGTTNEYYHLTSAQNTLVGALDADLATFSVPASTTISAFGATLVDDAAASNARTTLGLVIDTDVAATSFKTIAVATQSNVVADSATDTMTLVAGTNMTITTNASTDTITFAATGSGATAIAIDVRDYGAVPDCVRVVDIVTTATSTAATSVVGGFTSALIGKRIHIIKHTTQVYVFRGTITAVPDANTLTLSAAAAVTVASGDGLAYIGTDNTTSINNALAAASAIADQVDVNQNNPVGGGKPIVVFPCDTDGTRYLFISTLSADRNVAWQADAMLVSSINTALTDRTWAIEAGNGMQVLGELKLDVLYGMGITTGTVLEDSNSIFDTIRIWNVGNNYNAGLTPTNQIGLLITGYGFDANQIWIKNASIGLKIEQASDVFMGEVFIPGCDTGIWMSQAEQCSFHSVVVDTVPNYGMLINTGCHNIHANVQASSINSTDLTYAVSINEYDTNICSGLNFTITGQRCGGKLLYLNYCEDSTFRINGTNATYAGGGGTAITEGITYGANNAGSIFVTANLDGGITPYTGTPYGVLHTIVDGVETTYGSLAFPIANEATDTTCFPLFVTAATGSLAPKSNASLTFNSNTASLGCTTFVGALTGNVTGNVSGTAATVTTGAQPAITSLGTLTTLTVDDITINGNTISSAGASTLAITPTAGQAITFDGTITLDAGVIAGATSITSTAFVGTLSTASQPNITGVGTITTGVWTGTDIAVADGGTGSSTAAGARTNLGLVIDTDVAATSFKTIVVSGQSDVVADSATDTLTLAAGTNITLTTNAGTDTITITAASGAGAASEITVANEATDTTCFPVFVTAATGDLPPKSNAGLTFNSNTVSLGCTTFVGALTGNATTATTLATGRTIAITGDLAYTSPTFDGSGNVTAAGTLATTVYTTLPSAQVVTVNNAASPYTILTTDVVILVDTSGGAVTLNLPSPATKRRIKIKDSTGSFGTNACTVARNASEQIEGIAASLILRAKWGNYELQSNGTNWFKVSAANNLASLTYTTAGGTFTAPAGVTQVVISGRGGSGGGGGGGAGGGGSTAAGAAGGGGGGPGGSVYTATKTVTVVPNTGYTVVVGAGGIVGTAGVKAAANASGSTGGNGVGGGDGGVTTFGSLFAMPGGIGGGQGNGGQFTNVGTSSYAGPGVTYGVVGASGGVKTAAGGSVTQGYQYSPWAISRDGGAGGAAAGALGGGGGGAGGVPGPADAQPPAQTAGGAAGADGANGNVGVTVNAATSGVGGSGGPGGGGGGRKAATGSQGGDGAAGGIGVDGYLTVTWQE